MRPFRLPRPRRSTGTWRALVLASALTMGSTVAPAQDGMALKAAIIFNLLQFVQWPASAGPASAGAPLVLCASRDGALWWHLQALADRPLSGGRSLAVRPWPAGSSVGDAACHAAFLEQAPAPAAASGRPVLVIADVSDAPMTGSVVALRRAGERIAFEVDLAAARRAGLQVSSKLLRLATRIHE